jgi:acylphosphatase
MPVIHLKVVGRVQGVGFRWFVCKRARELGIAGWVKNTKSGDVEVAASGESSVLALLETAVARGPSGANVTGVHQLPSPTDGTYPMPFKIHQ